MAPNEVDAFLADSVTVAQGKLYALGAGWNRIFVSRFPSRHDRVAIGLLFRVPAGEASRARGFEVRILGPNGEALPLGTAAEGPVERIRGEFTAGGNDEQIVPIAMNLNGLLLPRPGDYRAVVAIDGEDVKTLAFRVETLPPQAPPQAPSPPNAAPPQTGTAGYL